MDSVETEEALEEGLETEEKEFMAEGSDIVVEEVGADDLADEIW